MPSRPGAGPDEVFAIRPVAGLDALTTGRRSRVAGDWPLTTNH